MSEEVKPRVRIPATAKKGEIIEIKTTVNHPMENGNRKGPDGNLIPKKIINLFVCKFNGKEVFRSEWFPVISANPFLSFFVKVEESGKFEMEWTEDTGQKFPFSAEIKVEA